MSILIDQNASQLADSLNAGFRALVFLHGEAYAVRQEAIAYIEKSAAFNCISIGERNLVSHVESTCSPKAVLGREFHLVIYDAFQGLDPDLLGAVSGCVARGGVLLICCPNIADWSKYPDPYLLKFAMYGVEQETRTSGFLRRLTRLIDYSSQFCVTAKEGCHSHIPYPVMHLQPVTPNTDQDFVVRLIEGVVTGQRKKPLVLLANRGRGKSTSLGIAAGNFLSMRTIRIVVCAVTHRSTLPVFKQVAAKLEVPFYPSTDHIDAAGGYIKFMEFDKLILEETDSLDLLLIDEAAGFSLNQLERLAKRFSRIVFSTTVHGYEGSGRGFLFQFDKSLRDLSRGVRHATLEAPVRWPVRDPLETFTNKLLLLDSESIRSNVDYRPDISVFFRTVSQEELSTDEVLLEKLHGLMQAAHYRTRPSDLRHIMDGDKLEITIALAGTTLIGALVCVFEGGFNEKLAASVLAGYSRPRGHIIAETLAAHLGEKDGPMLLGKRVMRIAVAPDWRRRSIGSRLIEFAVKASEVDYVASSFSIDAQICTFWDSLGFAPIRVGNLYNRTSGSRSLTVFRAKSEAGIKLGESVSARFTQLFLLRLPGAFKNLRSDHCLGIVKMINHKPSEHDFMVATMFATTSRNVESALPELQSVLIGYLGGQDGQNENLHTQYRVLIRLLLQQYSETECVNEFCLSGKKELHKRARQTILDIIESLRLT